MKFQTHVDVTSPSFGHRAIHRVPQINRLIQNQSGNSGAKTSGCFKHLPFQNLDQLIHLTPKNMKQSENIKLCM